MKSFSSRNISTFITLLGLTVALTSCLGDKTLDDYRADKFRQDLTIDLKGDSRVQTSSDNLTSEQKAVVRGTVTYAGGTNASVNFDEGYYDEQNGVLQATIPIRDESGTVSRMSLYGTIVNGSFTGGIEAEGFPNFGGTFSLIKDGPVSESSGLLSTRVLDLSSESRSFKGKYRLASTPTEERSFTLTIINRETTPEQIFLNVFRPTRTVNLDVRFAYSQITFNDVHIDDRTHTLLGQTVYDGFNATIECYGVSANTSVDTWNCNYSGSGHEPVRSMLTSAGRVQRRGSRR
jgi:hypothetical protein